MVNAFIVFLFNLVVAAPSFAGVFTDGVKFFEETKSEKIVVPKEVKGEERKKGKFSWKDQLDIENDQFFKEGEYTPPAPFMEALRRPTKENIDNFEKWQTMRNLLLQRYESARMQYIGVGPSLPKIQNPMGNVNDRDIEKYRFIFYFESTCSSCHSMFSTINEMSERGVYIEAIRVDRNDNEVKGLEVPWTFASADELKKLNLKAVPVLVAIDEKTKKAYRMVGKKSMKQILQVISQAKSSG